MLFERSCWAAGDDGSVGLAVIGNGSAWLISSELDVGKTDTSDKGAVVSGGNSGLVKELRMAEIPNECPCLVGPHHIS